MDSVKVIGEALRTLAMRPLLPDPEPILCDSRDLWRDGEMFNDVLRKVGSFDDKNSVSPIFSVDTFKPKNVPK